MKAPLQESSDPFPWKDQGEVFRIETPEMTSVEYPVADLGTRIVAVLLDYLILFGVGLFMLALLAILIMMGMFVSEAILILFSGLLLCWFLGTILYFVWFELKRRGQTPGKRKMGIRVVSLSGRELSFGASLIRNLARYVDEIPIFLIIPALVPGRRRIGDLLGQTIVVRVQTRPPVLSRPLTKASLEGLGGSLKFLDSRCLKALDPEDLNLLEYLEERLRHLRNKQKREVLVPIVKRYLKRLGLEDRKDEILQDPFRFLQEMAFLMKRHFKKI